MHKQWTDMDVVSTEGMFLAPYNFVEYCNKNLYPNLIKFIEKKIGFWFSFRACGYKKVLLI